MDLCVREGNLQPWHPFHSPWSMTNALIVCLLTTWLIFGLGKPTGENWQLRSQPCVAIQHWPILCSSDTVISDDATCFCKCYKHFKWKEWLINDTWFFQQEVHILPTLWQQISLLQKCSLPVHIPLSSFRGPHWWTICKWLQQEHNLCFVQALLHTARVLLSKEEETT